MQQSSIMATLLLIAIYIAFIGLGIPDSLFGTAWPAIYDEFRLPISFGSFVTVITCIGTVTSSMLSARLIKRFGTRAITLVSTALTAVAILGMSHCGNFWMICLCAVPLGLGAGSIDAALNNYVSLHYSSAQMNFLHCFYGIGITVSPWVLAEMISGEGGWRGGCHIAFLIQISITAVVLLSWPLWKRAFSSENNDEPQSADEQNIKTLSVREMWRIPGVKLMWMLFICSVSLEMSCGVWGSTYLVEHKGLAASEAAETIMFYFMGIAIGRFLSGMLAIKMESHTIIYCGAAVLGIGIIGLILAPGITVSALALMTIGIGNGPMFPNLTYLTPSLFGKENSPAIMGSLLAVSYIAMMIMPVFCGLLGQWLGMWIFPFFILAFYVMMVAEITRLSRRR